jgi:hypothetical protein
MLMIVYSLLILMNYGLLEMVVSCMRNLDFHLYAQICFQSICFDDDDFMKNMFDHENENSDFSCITQLFYMIQVVMDSAMHILPET